MNKLSSVCRILCPLVVAASCGTGDQPPGNPDEDYTGIEEAAQGLTDLSAQCTWASGTGFATLALATGDVAMVSKLSSGALGVNGYACGAATTAALKKLIVTGTAGSQTLILDYLGGVFGAGIAANVGVDVDLGGGTDALKIRGTKLADTIVFGATGIAINTDAFKDIAVANVETFVATLSDGDDNFSGAGNAVTGGAFPTAVTVYGGAGNDTLRGGDGADTLNGGDGNDTFTTGAVADGADTLVGGAGTDIADYSLRTAAVNLSIDGVANDGATGENDKVMTDVENATGGAGDDTITGSALDNVLVGGAGNDTILGGLGNDTLRGGDGNDILHGDAGDDTFDEEAAPSGNDTIVGGAGIDKVDYSARTADLVVVMDGATASGDTANTEADLIGTDVENLIGGSGADSLTGNAGDNQIEGGPGTAIDTIFGLAGDDLIDGGAGADVVDCGLGDADILLDLTVGTQTGCEL